jgi:hypothetical protein
MRVLKVGIIFLMAFLLAWVVFFTFTQAPFQQTVPARLLFYQTPAIAIWVYLLGSLGIGLTIGMGVAAILAIGLTMALRRKEKELRDLRGRLDDTARAVRIASASAGAGSPPPVPLATARTQDE